MTDEEKISLIEGTIGIEGQKLTPTMELSTLDMWDSIGKLFLMSMVKKEFGYDLTPAEVRTFTTVGDIIAVMK